MPDTLGKRRTWAKRDEAIKLATQFVLQAAGPNPRCMGQEYEHRFIDARQIGGDEWPVMFEIQMLGPVHSIIDGPVVVTVDLASGKVNFL